MPVNVARYYAGLGSVELLDVDLPMPSGPVGFVTREATAPSPVFDELLDALRPVGQAIAQRGAALASAERRFMTKWALFTRNDGPP